MIHNSTFKAAWWLSNPHAQTLWPFLFRRRPKLKQRHETVELPDGDFLDIAWSETANRPLVLVMHGLEGSIRSHYAGNLLKRLEQSGYATVFMHFRGCSGRPNRKDRSYHSGETQDLAFIMQHVRQQTGQPVFAAIGFSLGGNVLLKWLGETGDDNRLTTAIAISVPFQLDDIARRLERGASRLYQNHLLASLRRSYLARFRHRPSPLQVDVNTLKTFREYDDRITAPLNGFRNVDHYYAESSSRQYLDRIAIPTLILHALDDPFMHEETVPVEADLSPSVTLELSSRGGHVGFISGRIPCAAKYWLEERIVAQLDQQRRRLKAPSSQRIEPD